MCCLIEIKSTNLSIFSSYTLTVLLATAVMVSGISIIPSNEVRQDRLRADHWRGQIHLGLENSITPYPDTDGVCLFQVSGSYTSPVTVKYFRLHLVNDATGKVDFACMRPYREGKTFDGPWSVTFWDLCKKFEMLTHS